LGGGGEVHPKNRAKEGLKKGIRSIRGGKSPEKRKGVVAREAFTTGNHSLPSEKKRKGGCFRSLKKERPSDLGKSALSRKTKDLVGEGTFTRFEKEKKKRRTNSSLRGEFF